MELYDADYYERGIETGKSNYQNYSWRPELTIPMAMAIIDYLGIKATASVLDFGCAKGYLVKAMRMLHRETWGYDISRYATSEADSEVRSYVTSLLGCFGWKFEYIICKDVLEHIPENKLRKQLAIFDAQEIFTIVPLGVNGKYKAPANDRDATHVICEGADWWIRLFANCGWSLRHVSDTMPHIKDHYPAGTHLFMIHRRKK